MLSMSRTLRCGDISANDNQGVRTSCERGSKMAEFRDV
ncbi:MAG: hypothetical protein QOJ29_4807, partial [Thermoleophilaceae bacterium]|nr:hypothetical protein [Thermoleophilaceae bacterium]